MKQRCRSFFILLAWLLLLGLVPTDCQTLPAAEAQYTKVVRLISATDFAAALTAARQLLERTNEHERAYYRVLQAARAVANPELARALFEGLLTMPQPNYGGYYGLGLYYEEKRDYAAALQNYQQCLSALPNFHPPILSLVGAYRRAGKAEEAERYLKALLAAAPESATWHLGLGYYYLLQARFDDASQEFELAQSLNPRMAEACYYRVFGFMSAERSQDALNALQQCLPPLETGLNGEHRKSFHLQQGAVYASLGLYPQAANNIEQAVQLARQIGDVTAEEQALGILGNLHLQHDQNVLAKAALTQALAIAERDQRQRNVPIYLGNLAKLYLRLGDGTAAMTLYEQALSKASDPDVQLDLLSSMGKMFAARKEDVRALACFERLIELERQSSLRLPRVRVKEAEAYIHISKGNYSEAIESFRTAISVVRSGGNLEQELTLTNSLGELFLRINDWRQAVETFQYGAQLAVRRIAPRQGWRAYLGLGRAFEQQGKLRPAQEAYRQAIELIESVRIRLDDNADTIYFLHDKLEPYRRLVAVLMRLKDTAAVTGEMPQARRLTAEAFQLTEQAQARALIDSLRANTERLQQMLSPDLQMQRWELQARFSRIDAQLRQATVVQQPEPEQLKKLETALKQTALEFQEWRQQVRQRNPRFAELNHPETLTVEQVQQLLKPQ